MTGGGLTLDAATTRSMTALERWGPERWHRATVVGQSWVTGFRAVSSLAEIVPDDFLHFLHPWRSDAADRAYRDVFTACPKTRYPRLPVPDSTTGTVFVGGIATPSLDSRLHGNDGRGLTLAAATTRSMTGVWSCGTMGRSGGGRAGRMYGRSSARNESSQPRRAGRADVREKFPLSICATLPKQYKQGGGGNSRYLLPVI